MAAIDQDGVRRVAIVLAAGEGSRMGGNKARLIVGPGEADEPLALLHARRFGEAGCGEVILVTRAEVAPLFAPFASLFRCAISRAPDPAGSLAIGLAEANVGDDDVVLVTPVDVLPAKTETIAALVAALAARDEADAASPVHAGRGGHPIAARARVLRPIASTNLRDLLAALGPRRVRLAVDDAAIHTDLDTPDALGHAPRFFSPA